MTSQRPETPASSPVWFWPAPLPDGNSSEHSSGPEGTQLASTTPVAKSAPSGDDTGGWTGALAALVPAAIALGVSFGLEVSGEQQAAIIAMGTAITTVIILLARRRRRRS